VLEDQVMLQTSSSRYACSLISLYITLHSAYTVPSLSPGSYLQMDFIC